MPGARMAQRALAHAAQALAERRTPGAGAQPAPTPAAGAPPQQRPECYRLGPVRNEVVGEQPPPEGAPAAGEPAAGTRSSADVYVFGDIGGWFGADSEDFVRDVAALDVDHIDLHINSPGGIAWEGIAMANVVRAHRAEVTVWVDGLAGSAASVLAMAGDEVVMNVGSQLMIHDASTISWGNAEDLRKTVDALESLSNAIASTYAARAGEDTAFWRAAMVAESWYTAEEAVAAGLADRVATDADKGRASGEQVVPGTSTSWLDWWDSAAAVDRFDLSVFAHAGRADAPPPPMPARASADPLRDPTQSPTPAGSTGGSSTTQIGGSVVDFPDEQVAPLRAQLGLADDADGAAILAAVTHRLTQAPTAREGTVIVDQTTLEQLQASARLGQEAHARQQREDRERLVTNAVADGRIPPARRDAWVAQLEADPGAAQVLASLAPGLVPVAEIGYTAGGASLDDAQASADDEAYYAAYPERRPQQKGA